MKLPYLFPIGAAFVACTGPVDSADFDTACDVDADCTAIACEDPCGGCPTCPVARADTDAIASVEAAQAWCFGGVGDCLNTAQPACIEGACVLVTLQ